LQASWGPGLTWKSLRKNSRAVNREPKVSRAEKLLMRYIVGRCVGAVNVKLLRRVISVRDSLSASRGRWSNASTEELWRWSFERRSFCDHRRRCFGLHLHAEGVVAERRRSSRRAGGRGTSAAVVRYSRRARHLLGFVRPPQPPPATAAARRNADKTSGEIAAKGRSTRRIRAAAGVDAMVPVRRLQL